jgi:hypothetical protein
MTKKNTGLLGDPALAKAVPPIPVHCALPVYDTRPWVEIYNNGPLFHDEMRRRAVLGIDPSLTGFAYCLGLAPILEDGVPLFEYKPHYELQYGSPPAKTPRERMDRYRQLIWPIVELTLHYAFDAIFIENYAFAAGKFMVDGEMKGGKMRGMVDRSELGGMLRDALIDRVPLIYEPGISQIKKWATGRGVGQKVLIATHLARDNKRTFKDSDHADSFAVMQMAAATFGYVAPHFEFQRAIVAKIRAELAEQAYNGPQLTGDRGLVREGRRQRTGGATCQT